MYRYTSVVGGVGMVAQFILVPFATGKLKIRDSILIIMDLSGKHFFGNIFFIL